MKIKMFTKTICGSCKTAKQQLSFLPVPVEIEEINIETHEDMFEVETIDTDYGGFKKTYLTAHDYVAKHLGSMSTPTFLFEDGSVVRGFEMGQIMEKLGL